MFYLETYIKALIPIGTSLYLYDLALLPKYIQYIWLYSSVCSCKAQHNACTYIHGTVIGVGPRRYGNFTKIVITTRLSQWDRTETISKENLKQWLRQ